MLDYVAVKKEWIFSLVGFSVVAAIIFVVRSILNRRRFDGSISTRPFPAEIVRDTAGKRPAVQHSDASQHYDGVRRILPFLSVGYVIYALLIAWFICRLLFRVYRAQSAGQMQLSGFQWMPLAMTSFFAFAFIGICLCLTLCLSARRWRRGALVLACISCISIPIGTILGGLTIYALTRREVSSDFT